MILDARGIKDIFVEWSVHFWHEGLTNHSLAVTLNRENITAFRNYLSYMIQIDNFTKLYAYGPINTNPSMCFPQHFRKLIYATNRANRKTKILLSYCIASKKFFQCPQSF